MIESVVDYVSRSKPSDWPPGVSDMVNSLQKYQGLLNDYTQAQVLQGLGRGATIFRHKARFLDYLANLAFQWELLISIVR